jgi:hypothetical protein
VSRPKAVLCSNPKGFFLLSHTTNSRGRLISGNRIWRLRTVV